ncbi:hypothetical protein RO21_11810 [[Actinobacillus] muris]|uniref:Uncharacterized protein n=1 Tax=Muribacter muris TaxID=67855 RepID=A0A0J5P436_9PAST|nr:hypothetical protein [Muribacter muris]KMK50440.1 hypothetical protein RO21_11810 [[Actinobacillus] muris] [Muribacter muris]
MIYSIEYSYKDQATTKSFHFVEAENEQLAVFRAVGYIAQQLYFRFGNEVNFKIEKIELVKA